MVLFFKVQLLFTFPFETKIILKRIIKATALRVKNFSPELSIFLLSAFWIKSDSCCYSLALGLRHYSALECLPSFFRVLVSEGQDVRGPPAAVTHHHGDGRCVPEVLQHNGDDIRPPLHDERHHRDTLADTCRAERGGAGSRWGWMRSGRNQRKKK